MGEWIEQLILDIIRFRAYRSITQPSGGEKQLERSFMEITSSSAFSLSDDSFHMTTDGN